MLEGIRVLADDMKLRMTKQQLVAQNIANATTAGYKRQRAFERVLDEAARLREPGNEARMRTHTSFEQGPIDQTGRPLDLAINGDGFFAIETPEGERYTRCGAFTLSKSGLLTTLSGDPVLGSGGPIQIDGQAVTIGKDGRVYVDGSEVGLISIVRFENPQVLVREGNRFAAPNVRAIPVDPEEVEIVQGAIERSNVNPSDEMTEMISLHRSFEADQRSIRLQDESARQLIERVGRQNRR